MAYGILYIAGYGRSGSTILDLSLARHPQAVSGGEIYRAAEIFSDPEALCTCGNRLADCPVWGPVRPIYEESARGFGGLTGLQEAFSTYEGIKGLRAIRRGGPDRSSEIGLVWEKLNTLSFSALARSAENATWVVDSSKTARGAAARPVLLSQLTGNQLMLLPMQRSLPGVLASARKGSNRAMEKGQASGGSLFVARSLMGWILANASSRRSATLVPPENVMAPLWYEALRRAPKTELETILTYIGLNAAEWTRPRSTEKIHMIGGNRTRFTSSDVIQADLPSGDLLTRTAIRAVNAINRLGVV